MCTLVIVGVSEVSSRFVRGVNTGQTENPPDRDNNGTLQITHIADGTVKYLTEGPRPGGNVLEFQVSSLKTLPSYLYRDTLQRGQGYLRTT